MIINYGDILEEVHINFGARDNNLCLISIESQLVHSAIVTDYAPSALKSTGRVCYYRSIISNAHSGPIWKPSPNLLRM